MPLGGMERLNGRQNHRAGSESRSPHADKRHGGVSGICHQAWAAPRRLSAWTA